MAHKLHVGCLCLYTSHCVLYTIISCHVVNVCGLEHASTRNAMHIRLAMLPKPHSHRFDISSCSAPQMQSFVVVRAPARTTFIT